MPKFKFKFIFLNLFLIFIFIYFHFYLELNSRNLWADYKRQIILLEQSGATPHTADRSETIVQELDRKAELGVVSKDIRISSLENAVLLPDMSIHPLKSTAGSDIGTVEINSHLKGSYQAVKKAISDVLDKHKGLALDALTIHRDRTTDAVVDVELKLTFFYRTDVDAKAP